MHLIRIGSALYQFKSLSGNFKFGCCNSIKRNLNFKDRLLNVLKILFSDSQPSKDFQYLAKGNTYTLEIAEIFPEDSGTYTCEAFNDAGECFSTATLNVVVPGEEPHPINFKSFPKSLTVTR